jgi:outer membrane protein OmpA-like peptidoglycan-associated protein
VIIGGPSAETGDTTAALQFQVDPGTVAQCSIDGTPFDWCGSPATYTNLALGPHSFAVREVDGAGNVSPAATRRWRIDVGFKPGDVGTNVKSVKGLVNSDVAAPDSLLGIGCALNRGSLHQCAVAAYAETGGARKAGARKASVEMIGTGTTTLTARGQSSAVVDVKLNAAGQALVKAHPEGVPVTLQVTAQPFDSDQDLVTTSTSTLHPPQMLIVPSRGMFAGGSSDLGSAGLQYVKAVAKMLPGATRVRCEGHTDNSASTKRARAVSFLRAKAVCDALRSAGVSGTIGAVGLGSAGARGDNSTAAGRLRNRRVDIRVWF